VSATREFAAVTLMLGEFHDNAILRFADGSQIRRHRLAAVIACSNSASAQKADDEPVGPITACPPYRLRHVHRVLTTENLRQPRRLWRPFVFIVGRDQRKQLYQVADDECGGLAVLGPPTGRLVLPAATAAAARHCHPSGIRSMAKRAGAVISHIRVRAVALSPDGKRFAAAYAGWCHSRT